MEGMSNGQVHRDRKWNGSCQEVGGGRREWGICVQWVQSFSFTRQRVLWMGGGDGSTPMLNVLNATLKSG